MDTKKIRVLREVTERQDSLLKILDAVNYAKIENITIKDGQIRTLEVRLLLDFDRPEEFKKAIEELKTIPLL
ncbi:MAG: hypothetical protein KatS3mg101_1082 [Patescibacteria group bacterium]|nr:MAG: hypothetical protein KatS3mg101_1082 [Patescibacteria group bacterium]